jgi:hypothetical protein
MKNADISIGVGGINLEGKMDMVHTTEKDTSSSPSMAGKYPTPNQGHHDETTNHNRRYDATKPKAELTGEIVLRTDQEWLEAYSKTPPSEKQLKELKNFDEPLPDDDSIPSRRSRSATSGT